MAVEENIHPEKPGGDHTHVERTLGLDEKVQGWTSLTEDAREATANEHKLTVLEALRRYPKCCFWTGVVSLCIIMDGYDQALLGSFFAYPSFLKRYGYEVGNGTYELDAGWQSALGFASSLGNMVGIFINSIITERFGHKKSLLGTLVILVGLIFIPFFAPSIQVLFTGQILCGVCWGVFTTLAPAYASEVSPVALRASLETFVVLCWGIGQFVAWGVLLGLNQKEGEWAYRIPFAVQWVWPAIILPIAVFAPESPWWLVRKGRLEDAVKSVIRLSSDAEKDNARKAVALMVETTNLEMEMTRGARFIDCFRGSNLWRTEISCFAWASQVWAGFVIQAYSTYFFEQAGLPAASAYKMNVGVGGLHFLCTLLSVFVTNRFGRRRIYLCGLTGLATTLFIIGFLALAPQSVSIGYAQSTIYLLWYAIYEFTIGPVAYIIVAEASSTRLRSKTIGLARNLYNISNIIASVASPYILGTTHGNWKGKVGFLSGGLAVLCFVWTFFRLPETKGRTYEELDILFTQNLSARQFKKQVVVFHSDTAVVKERTETDD